MIYILLNLSENGEFLITGQVVKSEVRKISIGVLIPLTGKYASLGEQVKVGFDMAVSDFGVNNRGYKLHLIYEDTGSDKNKAITGAHKLLSINKVNILLGPFSSGGVLAIAPTTELLDKILFTPISSSSKITNAGDFVFRNRETGAIHGGKMAEFLISQNMSEVAVMQAVSSNAISYSAAFKKRFKELGGEVIYLEKYNSDSAEFRTQIFKLLESRPRVVYLAPTSVSDAGVIVKGLRDLHFGGIIASTPTIINQDDFFKVTGKASDKVIVTAPILNSNKDHVNEFMSRYNLISGMNASAYAANGYDSVRMIGDAVISCGGDKNTFCIRDYLYGLTDYPGISGKTSFDKNGDVKKKLGILRAANGTFVKFVNEV